MGAFTDLFKIKGRSIPRVSVVEAFAENPDDKLSAPEIQRITGVSRRAVYLILKNLTDEGVIIRLPKETGYRAQYYVLNPNDLRARYLAYVEGILTLGKIESRIKRERGISQSELLPESYLSDLPTSTITKPIEFMLVPSLETAANAHLGGVRLIEKDKNIPRKPQEIQPYALSGTPGSEGPGWIENLRQPMEC